MEPAFQADEAAPASKAAPALAGPASRDGPTGAANAMAAPASSDGHTGAAMIVEADDDILASPEELAFFQQSTCIPRLNDG